MTAEIKSQLVFLAKKKKVPQVHVLESLILRQYEREKRKCAG